MAEKDIIIEEKTTEEKTTAETKEEVKEETPLEDVVLETEGGTKSLLGATSGTDIAATSLDTKTTPAGTDNLILFNQNTNVGYQINYDNLADAILNKITSKTFANQVGGSSAATLLAQLSTLNSNLSNMAGLTKYTLPTGESLTIGQSELPHAYIAAFYADVASALGMVAGVGYAYEATRHKMGVLVQYTSNLVVTQSTTQYGLDISNNTGRTITIYVLSLFHGL